MTSIPGNLYVVAAPSGAGKTTLVKALVDSTPGITVSISHTTRSKRPGETHGVNYYFINEAEFRKMIEQNNFLEYATVFNNLYGTSRKWVEETLAQGLDVILEIDWQGAHQIHQLFPNSVSIFILPPSKTELENRLLSRNQDSPEIIQQRLSDVREAVSHIEDFTHVVMNDDFEKALLDLQSIVTSTRLCRNIQVQNYKKLLDDLRQIS